jgi:hypothetical protein
MITKTCSSPIRRCPRFIYVLHHHSIFNVQPPTTDSRQLAYTCMHHHDSCLMGPQVWTEPIYICYKAATRPMSNHSNKYCGRNITRTCNLHQESGHKNQISTTRLGRGTKKTKFPAPHRQPNNCQYLSCYTPLPIDICTRSWKAIVVMSVAVSESATALA